MNIIHSICGVLPLLAGLGIFLFQKGTIQHKRAGWIYTSSMLILLITSFFIYDLFGGFGAYHILSIVSLVTLLIGISMPLFFRDAKGAWLHQHYFWMSYSYVGLVMATGSHLFALVPSWPDWLRITAFWAMPYLIGTALIYANRRRLMAQHLKDSEIENETTEVEGSHLG